MVPCKHSVSSPPYMGIFIGKTRIMMTITNKLDLTLLTEPVPYRDDPTGVFSQQCQTRHGTLLLESADIDSKCNLQSMMIIDSALRIIAMGNTVQIQALSDNGMPLLPVLQQALTPLAKVKALGKQLHITFDPMSDGQDEDSRLKQPSVFDVLRMIPQQIRGAEQHREAIFLGGLFAYDLVACSEPLPDLPSEISCPDYCFYLAECLLTLDHQQQTARLQASIFSDDPHEQQRLRQRLQTIALELHQTAPALQGQVVNHMTLNCNQSDAHYCQVVSAMQQSITQGDIFQVVPSRRFSLPCPSPLAAYDVLKKTNPSPYMFFMQDADFSLFGASPESALKYDSANRQVEIYPIAGTRPRGRKADGSLDADLDCRLELEMRTDRKELAEHLMLVDLARNDLARICTPGSRHVADLIRVDRYTYVMHLVSRVVGQLRDDLDALHAYRACMNMGTLSGAPKVKAMQLIAEHEGTRRGSYGGAIGYITGDGSLDTCIVIRSAWVENEVAYVQAGAGVVLDSDPQSEADESRHKARAVLRAIAQAHACQETF